MRVSGQGQGTTTCSASSSFLASPLHRVVSLRSMSALILTVSVEPSAGANISFGRAAVFVTVSDMMSDQCLKTFGPGSWMMLLRI
jgi:hypothetical protein